MAGGRMNLYDFFASKEKCEYRRWNLIEKKLSSNTDISVQTPFILNNFYISAIKCPGCNDNLYKTVFPPNQEFIIYSKLESRKLIRVFTCPSCKSFWSAVKGYSVADGLVFTVCYSDDEVEYNKLLNEMNNQGTTCGRDDL